MSKVRTNIYKIAELIAKDGLPCLLCTIGADGKPRTRYMAGYRIRNHEEIFLTTSGNSSKLKDIRANPHVQFILTAKEHKRVLTLNAKATIVQDVELRRALYEEGRTSVMFPVFDDSYGVIHIEPLVAEYLDVGVSSNPVVYDMTEE